MEFGSIMRSSSLTGTKGEHGGTVGSSVKESNGKEGLPVVEAELGVGTCASDPQGKYETNTNKKLESSKGPVTMAAR